MVNFHEPGPPSLINVPAGSSDASLPTAHVDGAHSKHHSIKPLYPNEWRLHTEFQTVHMSVIKKFPTPTSHFHTSRSSIDRNMAILLGTLKTAAEEVNPRAAHLRRAAARLATALNALSCTAPMRSELYPNYLIENRNRESKYMVILSIGISEVWFQINLNVYAIQYGIRNLLWDRFTLIITDPNSPIKADTGLYPVVVFGYSLGVGYIINYI